MTTLAIRVDAVPEIGVGHLGRCLALAHAARELGWRVVGIGDIRDESVTERASKVVTSWLPLGSRYPDPGDLSATLAALASIAPDWMVLDGYSFDAGYMRALRERTRLLVIDDAPRLQSYPADLLLDQNLGAERRAYHLDHGHGLLGASYVLLRPEFQGRARESASRHVRHLVVTLGGSPDPKALSVVFEGVNRLEESLAITVLTGTGLEQEDLLLSRLGGGHQWTLLSWHRDMPGLMRQMDLAISAAGSTAWELAYMGVPSVLVVLADNQAGIASAMDAEAAAVSVGTLQDQSAVDRLSSAVSDLIRDRERREALRARALGLVDGLGTRRVLEAMQCMN